MRKTLAIVSAAILGSGLLHLSVAAGATTCSLGSATVTITISGGTPTTIVRNGDAIDVNGSVCGTATVTNTDTIDVTVSDMSSPPITIDLSGGPFAPGATDEGDGSSEIEFQVMPTEPSPVTIHGTASADFIYSWVDDPGMVLNLNGNESIHDADVTIPEYQVVTLEVDGYGGPDVIDLGGDPSQPALSNRSSRRPLWAAPPDATAKGGPGNDTMNCALSGDTLIAGRGNDTIDCSNVVYYNLNIYLDPTTATTITGGANMASISGFENAVGGGGRDFIVANDPGPNALYGGPGDDTLAAGGGNNLLDGGPDGSIIGDTVGYNFSTTPVTADLASGTATTGDANDTLVGIEQVEGTASDDVFTGVPGQLNAFYGLAGNDTFTLDPADTVFGGDGMDTITAAGSPEAVALHLHAMSGNQFQSIESVVGSAFADQLFGAPGQQTIIGLGGRDDLEGKRGNDTLRGGVGRDALDGGMGADTCRGGPGTDTLSNCEL